MIRQHLTKQNWSIGQEVKVGFMKLRIKEIELTPGDYLPDAYIMESAKGKMYRFVPHNGLTAIYAD